MTGDLSLAFDNLRDYLGDGLTTGIALLESHLRGGKSRAGCKAGGFLGMFGTALPCLIEPGEQEWLAYIRRTLPDVPAEDRLAAYGTT